jgi:tetratricopeptide (TPR) repeat protein
MDEKKRTKITMRSALAPEFTRTINIDNVSYLVQTEDMGGKSAKIATRVYLKGQVLMSREEDYAYLLGRPDLGEKLKGIVSAHHRRVIDEFTASQLKKQKSKTDYFDDAKAMLRTGKGRAALDTLEEGLAKFPGDPFMMSYYGCLLAVTDKKPQEGIKKCREALDLLRRTLPFGKEFFYPVFYLNLGRAYLAADRKPEAVKAFQTGLRADPEYKDLLWEMKKLGARREPPIPFLKRSNPLNKYIGKLLGKG